MATRVVYVTVFLGFLFGLVAWLGGGLRAVYKVARERMAWGGVDGMDGRR